MRAAPTIAELREKHYAQRDVLAMYPALREDHLRYLQKWGFIRSSFRNNADKYFEFGDLTLLRQVNADPPVPARSTVPLGITRESP